MSFKIIPDFKIFTDATADHSASMMAGLPRITIIPMEVIVGDESFLYGPKGNITADQFYQKQRKGGFASTSQINQFAYQSAFEEALRSGYDVLYLCLSSGISGTYNSACNCMRELQHLYPERKLICIDTLCAAVGEGLLVREAAKRQYEGMTIDEVAQWVQENKLNICHWFTVNTFEHLKHGGRVSGAAATVGSMLNIKPLLHMDQDGCLKLVKKPRGRHRAMTEQLTCMKQGWLPEISPMVVIGHGDDLETANMLKNEIMEQFPQADVHIADIGPVIGAHTGPGILALIYWGSNR